MKKLIILIMLLVLLPLVDAVITIQYGEDNLTWTDVTFIDEATCEAYQINLHGDTQYFFRGRNDTTEFKYVNTRTESGGDDRMLSIIFSLIAIIVFFALMAFASNIPGIKIFGYGVALIQLMNLAFIIWQKELGNSLINSLRINFFVIMILIFGIIMITLISFMIRLMDPSDDLDESVKDKPKW